MRNDPPVKPANLDPRAAELLHGLRRFPSARHIVLGGYCALQHYWDYRATHDVDAWWSDESTGYGRAEAARRLTELELRRPLETITDPSQSERARATRTWFRQVFLKPLEQ